MSSVGRPLKFKSVEELQEKIQAYFDYCDERVDVVPTKDGKLIEVPNPRPYTVSGLAYFLGTTRRTLIDYEQREDEFSHTIRAAKGKIEAFVEESLWTPKIASGVMFNLKNNFGWVEKTELEQNTKMDAKMVVKMEGDLDEWAK